MICRGQQEVHKDTLHEAGYSSASFLTKDIKKDEVITSISAHSKSNQGWSNSLASKRVPAEEVPELVSL